MVPVGLTFDDKLALRSRALAIVGAPLDLDAWLVDRARRAQTTPIETRSAI